MHSQVTTKRGDQGQTTALSGDALAKSHPIMECVGTLDELRIHTALTRARILEEKPEDYEAHAEFLLWLLHVYFLIGSACSDPLEKHPEYRKGRISPAHLERLEARQQCIEECTPLPHAFIAAASNSLAAQADVACTLARRFERTLVRLKEAVPEFEADDIFKFINRLSDFLYMLARRLEAGNHLAVNYALLERDGTALEDKP